MTTNRTPDFGPQGPSSKYNQRSVDFLDALDVDKNHLWLAGSVPGADRLDNVGFYSDARMLALPDDQRHHITCATYPPGMLNRDDSKATSVPFIVFDDVGYVAAPGLPQISGVEIDETFFATLPPPTWITMTSFGNCQYGYCFSPALTPAVARAIHAAVKRHPIIGVGLHSIGHYVRLPSGTNTKPGHKAFRTRLVLDPKTLDALGPSYTAQEFIDGFGLTLGFVPAGGLQGAANEVLLPEAVAKLLEMIPNTDTTDYDTWIRVGHAIYGATEGSADGLDLFMQWSARSAKFNVGQDTERTWVTLSAAKASASTLRRIIEDIHGPDSKERQAAAQVFAATSVFTAIDEEPATPTVDVKAVEKKLDALLREIAKTQPVPAHHKKADGADWSKGGKVQTLRDILKSGTVAPPVVVSPYERGLMSVLAGMPGLGKSLLILNQALAITYNRPDLVRYGIPRIQFPGDVIYISNEDGLGLMARRTQAWLVQHGLEAVDPPFEVIPLKSTLLTWDGVSWQPKCLAILEMILEYVRGGRDIAMIVVDTLATSVTGANENQASDMSPVMAFFDALAKAFWASVVFVHHVNKEAMASEDRSIVSIRGSSGITGAVRGAVTLTPAFKKEVEEFGWAGQVVIAEYVAKANDDRARYVACYYNQTAMGIPVADAVDPSVVVVQETPILTPLRPVKAIDDIAQMRTWRDMIEVATVQGQVRVYRANANNTGPKSVHKVLGVSVKKAFEIVEKLVELGQIEVVDQYDPDSQTRVPCVVMVDV